NPRRKVRLAPEGLDDLLARSNMVWDCMACAHCTVDCPAGIAMDKVVRKARGLAQTADFVPEDIKHGVETRLETGDVNGFTPEDFFETIEWLNEEIEDEFGHQDAAIPMDKPDVRFLYLPNPRELGTNVLHLSAMARLFYAFGESWTMSSRHTDVTNWGYFTGDDDVLRTMVREKVEGAEALHIETLVLSECGHAYIVYKKMLEELLGRKPGFRVLSMPELLVEMADQGKVRFDPAKNPETIAYHDPCNIARKAGQFEAPRRLLAYVCANPVELSPNRMHAICCGGGGGLLQDSTSKPRRMISGKSKADQIRACGAGHVATACLSCHRQLGELVKHYQLEVQVHTVATLASEALILP
ncbi:MAG: (Fe-S)-binding protein, partial [Desulfosarcinaceae bacterium]